MLVRMLISKGFACLEAEDGLEALGLLLCNSGVVSACPSNVHELPDHLDKSHQGFNERSSLSMKSLSRAFDKHNQRQTSIDAILIDFHMPRMNGPDAIVEIRNIGFRNPIIGVSGGDNKMMQQFLQAGANNVIQKPAQSDKLVELMLSEFRLVIQKEKTKETACKSLPLSFSPRTSYTSPHERLQKFLEEKEAVKYYSHQVNPTTSI